MTEQFGQTPDEYTNGMGEGVSSDPETEEKEKRIKGFLFQRVGISIGKPQPGKESTFLERSQRIAERVYAACVAKEVEIPVDLVARIDKILQDVKEATGIVVSYGPALQIIRNALASDPATKVEPGEAPAFLAKKFDEALGEDLEARVKGLFEVESSGTDVDYVAALEGLEKFNICMRNVVDESVTPGDLEEEPEEASVADIMPEILMGFLENYTLDELKAQPLLADDVLAVLAEFIDYIPQSWAQCSAEQQNAIKQLMSEAAASKPGAIIVDTENGPKITS